MREMIILRITHENTLYQLSFLPRLFPVNCYLVEEEMELTLIDAALPYSTKSILKAADCIGKPITRIVLTHGHQDHVGALDELKRSLPRALVYISARDSRLLEGDCSLNPDEPDTPIRGGIPKNVKTRADHLLYDGDTVGSLLAIHAPGHTPGSMAFLDTRSNALIAGDAMQTRGGVAVSGVIRPFFPFPAMATWHAKSALQSVQKLLDYKPSLLAAGHGRMIVNPIEAMKHAVDIAKHTFK